MSLSSTHSSKLFQDFRAIHPGNYRSLVHFYQQHEMEIDDLPMQEQFVIWCYYANALYGIGGGEEHIQLVNKILEYSIVYNIQYVDGIDIYAFMLYQKAISHLRISEWDKAVRIATQLLRIDPHQPQHFRLLRRCLLAKRPRWVKHLLATSLALLIVAAASTIGQIFVIEAFYPALKDAMWWVQILSFGLGTLFIGLAALGQQLYVSRRSRSLLQTAIHCQREKESQLDANAQMN